MNKLHPQNYNPADFSKIWNVRELIREMVNLMATNQLTGESDILHILARRERVFSVLSAYTGIDSHTIEFLFEEEDEIELYLISSISQQTAQEIHTIIEQSEIEIPFKEHLLNQTIDVNFCRKAFKIFIRYRIAVERAMQVFNGIGAAANGYLAGYVLADSLYTSALSKLNTSADEILCKFLGDNYKRTFSELELISNYNYPTVSDIQINNWKLEYD